MNPMAPWVKRGQEKFDAEHRAQQLKDRADRSQAGTDAAKVARRKAEEAQRNLERMKQMREEISRDKVKKAASRIVDAAKKAKTRKASLVKTKVGKENPEKGKTSQINMDPEYSENPPNKDERKPETGSKKQNA
jgi:hypothetical protein